MKEVFPLLTDNEKFNAQVKPNTAFLTELKSKLPEFFDREDNFDMGKFRQQLADKNINELKDGYQLNFIGKDYARRQAGEMPTTVIVPDEEQNQGAGKDSHNLFFTGDNLEVLRHLQANYAGKVDVIYIDPPYNTGNGDFVYPDAFEYSDKQLHDMLGMSDDQIERLKSIQGKSSHSAWLTFMYPRLVLAKRLLSNKGVIFISIDDNEQANLKELMDDIFGEINFEAQLAVEMSKTQGMKVAAAQKGKIVKNKEFVLVYVKNHNYEYQRRPLYIHNPNYDKHYSYYLDSNNRLINLMDFLLNSKEISSEIEKFKQIKKFSLENLGFYMENSSKIRDFILKNSNKIFQDAMAAINISNDVKKKILLAGKDKPYRYQSKNSKKKYLLIVVGSGTIRQLLPLSDTYHQSDDFYSLYGRSVIRGDLWSGFNLDMMNISKEDSIDFKNGKKPVRLIKQLIKWSGAKNGIIMDFFAGSATTASAVLNTNIELGLNNKFIMVQLPEPTFTTNSDGKEVPTKGGKAAYDAGFRSIDEISRERIRRAAAKIKADNELTLPADFDGSFKHYQVVKPTKQLLLEIEDFDPQGTALFNDMLNSYASDALGVAGGATGAQTILTTWLAKDGYAFDTETKHVDLAGYQATLVNDNRLYLINPGWGAKNTEALLNQLGTYQLDVQAVVLFGYSFNIAELRELENGLKQVDRHISLIKRY